MFSNAEELQEKIDAFFLDCDAKSEPYTITGLALALGTYRQTLLNYEERDGFVDTIKTAKLRCENYAEKRLYGTGQVTGPIFALKNFDWSDAQQVAVDHSSKDKSMSPSASRLSDMTDNIRNKPTD